MRINKYLASCGIASRRKSEEYILNGQVKINGKIITSLSFDVKDDDIVVVNDRVVSVENDKVYIMLNKPKGYLCAVSDSRGRPTVTKLIKDNNRIYPVGRLDYNTEGLLLLTNDGEFANKVMHPSNVINKTYVATLKSKPKTEDLDKLRHGIELEDGMTSPAIVSRPVSANGLYEVDITIHEGKNREVRRMFEAIGYKIYALKRIQIGTLELNGLKLKEYKYLTKDDIQKIFK